MVEDTAGPKVGLEKIEFDGSNASDLGRHSAKQLPHTSATADIASEFHGDTCSRKACGGRT